MKSLEELHQVYMASIKQQKGEIEEYAYENEDNRSNSSDDNCDVYNL